MRIVNSLLFATLVSSAACSTSEPSGIAEENQSLVTAAPAATDVVPGYKHALARSKFALGNGPVEKDEFGMHKVIGATGVFATRSSGLVTALANADAPARAKPTAGDAAAHNAAVRAYFVGAGIPEDQIDSVQDFEVVGAPASDKAGRPLQGTVAYRYSMIKRRIDGIPVPDSFAWAQVNADGVVVEEQVFWPDIPRSTVNRAKSFQAGVQQAADQAAYHAKLPPRRAALGVAIRHSPGEWDKGFEAKAVYDIVNDAKSLPATVHFDEQATPVAFAFEAPEAWGAAPPQPATK
jgi:hypothetical protein